MFAPHARSLTFMFFFSFLLEWNLYALDQPARNDQRETLDLQSMERSLWTVIQAHRYTQTHTQGHTQAGSISLCLHRYVRCISLQESSILMTLSLAHSRGFGACFDMKSLICRGIPGKGKPTWIQRDRQTSTLLSRCVSEHSEIHLITVRLKGLVRVALCSAW